MKTFKSEFHCTAEWAINLTHVEVYLEDDLFERITEIAKSMKELGLFSGELLNCVGYELFMDEDDDGTLEVFEPGYQIDGTALRVYSDGDFMVIFHLKHSGDEGNTDYLRAGMEVQS